MKVLYDGWPLVYGGNDPAAIHLLTLLAAHPAEIPVGVALPGQPFHALPGGIDALSEPAPDNPAGRLRWEQRLLPALARRSGASHVHTTGGPALFGAAAGLLSPAGFAAAGQRPSGFMRRLGAALAQGGASRIQAWLWPEDLPADGAASAGLPPAARRILPPVVHPVFFPEDTAVDAFASSELAGFDLPDTYILVHSPANAASISRILDAWSWAAGSISVNYPLLWVGLRESEQEALVGRLAEYGLADTTRPLPVVSLAALADLYRRCSAVLHLGEISPWADPARLALACARPLAAYETAASAALAGAAAYLVAQERPPAAGKRSSEARALGAALLTMIVEEGLADVLAQSARERSHSWSFERFKDALRRLYASV